MRKLKGKNGKNGKLFSVQKSNVRTKRNFAQCCEAVQKMAAFNFRVSFLLGNGAIKLEETIRSCL